MRTLTNREWEILDAELQFAEREASEGKYWYSAEEVKTLKSKIAENYRQTTIFNLVKK